MKEIRKCNHVHKRRRTYLRQEDHASIEDKCPDELNGDGNTVGRVVRAVLGGGVDDRSEEKTDGDGPLVARDDGATDPLGRALGLVHGDHDGDETDTETGEDTTDDEDREGVAASLHGDTETEDQTCDEDTATTTEHIREGGTEKGT